MSPRLVHRPRALSLLLAPGLLALAAQAPAFELPRPTTIPLRDGWLLRSSAEVDEDGEALSRDDVPRDGWIPTRVPSTVLSALIRRGVYLDFRRGLDAFKIPDSSDAFNERHDLARFSHLPGRNPWREPWWYRTEFRLPPLGAEERAWLSLRSINYRADAWLNGTKVADRESTVGMFRRFLLDITGVAREGENRLAVRIWPVDHPGDPDAQLEVFGRERGYHKEIMKDVTMVMSVGYDCMPTVPDRNMGICQDVEVLLTGPLTLRDPFVVTDLPLPRTDRAELRVSATVENATGEPRRGVLRGTIVETGTTFELAVELGPGQRRDVTFAPRPFIESPRLWWPSGYGAQDLYRLRLELVAGDVVSDAREVTFGVREVSKELHELDGAHGLRLLVNGERIFCRGGYIQPEILLDWDARRMDAEVRYFTAANLNLVYFEDIPNPPEAFLEACDRRGLLFGNCFYGCYWMTPGSGFPEDLALLESCTVDLIRRYRNHPSLVLYMAMNEGDTREDVYEMWRQRIIALDGTRIWIPSGTFPHSREDAPAWIRKDMPVGMTDVGASYTWKEPQAYYHLVREDRRWMFMIESGSASLPPVSSLAKFIHDLGRRSGAPFPLTETWAHHGANHYYREYDEALRRIHGEPATVAEYCWKGHLVTADQHRAMFEATAHRMWDVTSGFTQWKINACWPSVQWQIHDWYLKPTPSYYSIKRACEPLHVQLDLLDREVVVVNRRLSPASGLKARAAVYDLSARLAWEKAERIDAPANGFRRGFVVPIPEGVGPVHFVKLELRDAAGALASENLYWLSTAKPDDLRPLSELPMVDLEVSRIFERTPSGGALRVRVKNPSRALALFVQLAATRGPGGSEILPVLWDDNYFSLLPGETREVGAAFDAEDLRADEPTLEVGGWNVRAPFECRRLELSRSVTAPGEHVLVTAEISRTFLDGSRVPVLVDGKVEGSLFAWARGHATDELLFNVKVGGPGEHEIRVGSTAARVTVRQ